MTTTTTVPTTTETTAFPGTSGNTTDQGFTFDPNSFSNSTVQGVTRQIGAKQVWAPDGPASNNITKQSINQWLNSILTSGGLGAVEAYVPQLQAAGYLSSNAGADGIFNPRSILTALASAAADASDSSVPVLDWLDEAGKAAQSNKQLGGQTKFVRGGNVQVPITSPDVVQRIGDEVAQNLVGRRLKPDEVQTITGLLHSQELAKGAVDVQSSQAQEAQYAQSVAGGAIVGNSPLDAFMKSLSATESGGSSSAVNSRTGAAGTFQIMPNNWAGWSAEAGMPGAPFTPQNQQRVAEFKLQQYYNQFGSWQAVAVAWYAGPATAAKYAADPTNPAWYKKQGPDKTEPSIQEYVNRVVGKMGPAASQAQPPPLQSGPQAAGPVTSDMQGTTTIGGGSSFQTPTGTTYLLPAQETVYQAPEDAASATQAFLRNQRPTEYQANNLFNAMDVLDQAFRQGVGTKAAEPINRGAAL